MIQFHGRYYGPYFRGVTMSWCYEMRKKLDWSKSNAGRQPSQDNNIPWTRWYFKRDCTKLPFSSRYSIQWEPKFIGRKECPGTRSKEFIIFKRQKKVKTLTHPLTDIESHWWDEAAMASTNKTSRQFFFFERNSSDIDRLTIGHVCDECFLLVQQSTPFSSTTTK
jgi:hypothetical protein